MKLSNLILCYIIIKCLPYETEAKGNNRQVDFIIRESYSEVAAFIVSHFNEKCKLALHNCLFRTEWEKVFGKERLIAHVSKHRVKKAKRKKRNALWDYTGNNTFYYCQAFLIGKFCIDDYLIKSMDNFQCINGTDGNSPSLFKKSIYREQCKYFYNYFFDNNGSHQSSINNCLSNYYKINLREMFYNYFVVFIYYYYFLTNN